MDIGCADGKFTLSVAPYFKKVYGIDISRENLNIAKSHNWDKRSKNVEYSFQNAKHTSFEDAFFDVAYCRRGPTFYEEYARILKTGGYYVEIGIGEMDTMELQKIFGRGQGFGKWDKSRLDENLKKLKALGFKVVFSKNIHSLQYYTTYHEIDLFLQGVPIFEDYDSEKDKEVLQEYVTEFSTDKGIQLARHRLVMVVQKNSVKN